jgi:hypothetical protein
VIEERLEQAKLVQALTESIPVRDIEAYRGALENVPFFQLERPEKLRPSVTYLRLSQIALECMNAKSRRAVLCWPNCDPSPAAITAFTALADWGSCKPIKQDGYDALTVPTGLRALIYPYARSAHRALKHIYVDKDYVGQIQLKHQIRCNQPGADPAWSDFHKTLARVKKLTGLALDGKAYPEFANPCLDELLPSGPCAGTDARNELLWRVRTKTDLKNISRSGAADNPLTAKFYLFGLRANEPAQQAVKVLKEPIDIVFLQLNYTGKNRLGKDWQKRVQEFLSALDARMGPVPVIALTDDPWTFDRLRYDTLIPKPKKKSDPASPSSVIFARAPEIVVSQSPPEPEFAATKRCDAIAYGGEIESVLRRLRVARKSAADSSDLENADRLISLIGVVRRCASLPGSRIDLATFLETEVGALAAADWMASYRIGTIVSALRESNGTWPQTAREELNSLVAAVQSIWDRTDVLTPMAPLIKDVVKKFLRVSSRTVFAFQDEMLADFAAHALSHDAEIGSYVVHRLENGMVRFVDRAGLEDLENLPNNQKSHIKTLVMVAPSRATLLNVLAKPWLPDNLIVLADADMLESASRDSHRLGNYVELEKLKPRFAAFENTANAAVQRVRGSAVLFDREIEPSDDIDLPANRVVNLAGHLRADQMVIRFELDGGQIVLARPGTKLVVLEENHILPLFGEAEAKVVEPGDRVCVIGDAFMEMARPLLNITKRAAEEIRDYHELVLKRFADQPGSNTSERLAAVVAKMAMPEVTVGRARYWVDLEEQLEAQLDDVVPHAPLDFPTFMAFMASLSISEAIARRYWTWAVIAQRTNRLKAGMSIRDAYRGILVDQYAVQSDNPARARDVRQLRAAAENFVGTVRRKSEQRGNNAGA